MLTLRVLNLSMNIRLSVFHCFEALQVRVGLPVGPGLGHMCGRARLALAAQDGPKWPGPVTVTPFSSLALTSSSLSHVQKPLPSYLCDSEGHVTGRDSSSY